MNGSIYDFKVNRLDGKEVDFNEYRGKVLLIVNTASQCGFTPQYAGLEQLYQTYQPQGLVILGFPCNQFGAQEPGDAQKIAAFCSSKYHVTFPLFAKVEVNGKNAHPLYKFLKAKAKGLLGSEAVKWNFTKFMVNRNGEVLPRYAPAVKPDDLAADIERLLQG